MFVLFILVSLFCDLEGIFRNWDRRISAFYGNKSFLFKFRLGFVQVDHDMRLATED